MGLLTYQGWWTVIPSVIWEPWELRGAKSGWGTRVWVGGLEREPESECSSNKTATSFFMTSSHGSCMEWLNADVIGQNSDKPSQVLGREKWQSTVAMFETATGSSQLTSSSDHLLTTNQCDISRLSDLIWGHGCELYHQYWAPWWGHSSRKWTVSTSSGLGGAADIPYGELSALPKKGPQLVCGRAAAPWVRSSTPDVLIPQSHQTCHCQVLEMIKCDLAAMSPVPEETVQGSTQPTSVEPLSTSDLEI